MATFPYQEQARSVSKWILLPLRLFLGVTFIYAGIQKLTDPQFFSPSARSYIGKQIIGFATGSPLHTFLINVAVPHASFFGYLVAYGEIAIGLGTLVGFLLRPAAFSGMLISLMFFLSATWRVFPYFYGADIVFVFCWITMLLAGPMNTGLPALDELWAIRLLAGMSATKKKTYAPALTLLIGVAEKPVVNTQEYVQVDSKGKPLPASASKRASHKSRYSAAQYARESRRNFIWGAITGGSAMLVVAWFWNLAHASDGSIPTGTSGGGSTSTGASSTPSAAGSGSTIAQVSQVQNNSSVNFTLASNGDPGILVRLNNGQFVAYDATCTHAGCPVDYDPSSQLLICPCHGAEFDPSKSAAVVQGPAPTPLTNVPINVNNSTGNITLQ
ncbi:MAG TPA: TQO small subunit DoxD [Ktedonobacteraceae bacterium]|nr:TQO small subunit DoxD [Ktedonobacteraceae bacterium]